jgi:CO/xanthine dehydrogenase FAD-binding subunit
VAKKEQATGGEVRNVRVGFLISAEEEARLKQVLEAVKPKWSQATFFRAAAEAYVSGLFPESRGTKPPVAKVD